MVILRVYHQVVIRVWRPSKGIQPSMTIMLLERWQWLVDWLQVVEWGPLGLEHCLFSSEGFNSNGVRVDVLIEERDCEDGRSTLSDLST